MPRDIDTQENAVRADGITFEGKFYELTELPVVMAAIQLKQLDVLEKILKALK